VDRSVPAPLDISTSSSSPTSGTDAQDRRRSIIPTSITKLLDQVLIKFMAARAPELRKKPPPRS